jgi:hypothetical protein
MEILSANILFQHVKPQFSYAYATLTIEEKRYHTVRLVQKVPRYSTGMYQTKQNKKLNFGSVNFTLKEDKFLLFCTYITQILTD